MTPSTRLCIQSVGLERDWRSLYELSFPQDERMSVAELTTMFASGQVLLHRTTDENDELLCFSIVTPLSNFLLLAYIATDQTKQSKGVGSEHMKALLETLKRNYPNHLGLFFEIESTLETGLSEQEAQVRKRRLAFYERLGARRLLGKQYLLPSYSPGTPHRHGELLWFDFASPIHDEDVLARVIHEIYVRGYNVSPCDSTYDRVLSQFNFPIDCPAKSSKTSGKIERSETGNKDSEKPGSHVPEQDNSSASTGNSEEPLESESSWIVRLFKKIWAILRKVGRRR